MVWIILATSLVFIILQSESPSELELNALGSYLLGSLCFVVGALIEFALVVLINRVGSTGSKDEKNRLETHRVYNSAQKRAWSPEGILFNRKPITTNPCVENKPMNKPRKLRIFTLPSINGIDLAAFFVYLLLYLLFNCVYWAQYL